MSKTVEYNINQFGGGISDSPRKPAVNEFQLSKHFDIFTDPFRLIPYRSLEADTETSVSTTDLKQYVVKDFVYATTSSKLYGLGNNGSLTQIVQKANAVSGLWEVPALSLGNGAVQNGCFFEFQDYLWGFQGTNQIFKYGLLSGSPSITNTATGGTVGATITSVADGLIAADGNAYLAYNNVIVRISSGLTITDSAKTVPSNYKITSLANYGSYMAIAAAPISTFNGESKVFIWNLSSDLFQDSIDWGEGDLRVLETIEGMLVGVTDRYLNNSTGAGRGSMIIQVYSGGSPQVVKEVFTQALTGKTMPTSKAVKNNRLFFTCKIMENSAGTEYIEGLWSFGRKNSSYPFVLTCDIVCEEANTSGFQGFDTAANYFFIAHSNDGSVSKTNDASTFAYTSSYDSQIFDGGDVDSDKQLASCKLSVRKLATGETATLKYRIDGATSFTTIGSITTVGDISRTFINIESTGADLPSGKEWEFQITSTGGAEITGFKPKFVINDNI